MKQISLEYILHGGLLCTEEGKKKQQQINVTELLYDMVDTFDLTN